LTLHLQDRGRGGVDVQENIVPLAVLLDAIGEVAQAPIFLLCDLAAGLLDDVLETVHQAIDLAGGNVLACNEHALV
jgi:hypothetical protein